MSLMDICLDNVEAHACGIQYDARMLAHYLAMMPKRPDFVTRAEAELERAETVLSEALAEVRQMRADFAAIEVARSPVAMLEAAE